MEKMTIEIASNNIGGLLNSNELKLNKNDHIVLEQSLVLLNSKAKEAEILKTKVEELEALLAK